MTGGLLERERELAQLEARLVAAAAGSGGLVLIEGAPGIGKTALLDEVARLGGENSMMVLRARGVPLEDKFAFGVVRQLFEAAVPADQRRSLLSGPARLAGVLLGLVGDEASRPAADPGFASLHGLYWLCFNLAARRPVLLAIDDLHWSDAASLRFVNFLAERLEGLPLVMAVAFRPADAGPAPELLATVRSHPAAALLTPSELSESGSGRLINHAIGRRAAPEFARACFEVTGGNPFYLRALATALRADGVAPLAENAERVAAQVPETVVRALVLRLSHLHPVGADLAKALAVLGPDTELTEAAELAELDLPVAASSADALNDAGILAAERPLRFMHPIIQSAVYADLAPSERSRLHARAAHVLAERSAPAERIASHLLATEPRGDPWSIDVLRAAAGKAIAGGAPESAVRYLERARREGGDQKGVAELLLELGRAERLAGDSAALEHLQEALAGTSDPRGRAVIAQEMAIALSFRDRFDEAVGVLERAIADLGDLDVPLAEALEAQLLAAGALHLATRPLQREHLERVSARELGDSPTERMLLANVAQWMGAAGEPTTVVQDQVERALGDGRLIAELTSDSQIVHCAIDALIWSDLLELGRDWFNQALADARARGSLMGFLQAVALRAELFYRLGELAEAEADARDALTRGGPERWVLAPVAIQALVNVLIDRGHLSEAAVLLTSYDVPVGLDQSGMTNWFSFGHGRLALASGEWQTAAAHFLAIGEWMTAWGEHNPGLLDWRTGAALALAQLGDAERAQQLSDEVIRLSRKWGNARTLGVGLRTSALIVGGAQAVPRLRESASVLASSPARLEHARTLIDLGAILRRQNRRREARDPLREGLEIAGRCGASALVERAQSELIAAGARPRRRALSGLDALTPSEQRVAQLASDGLSTPAIAQQLFVTVNTIETHLRHIYLKLGVHSRAELSAKLARAAAQEFPAAHAGGQQPREAPWPASAAPR